VVNSNIIFHDNRSAILLAENGKASSSKEARLMEIRFFVKVNIASKLVEMHYCPTESMIADYYQAPVGREFKKYRDIILNDRNSTKHVSSADKATQVHRSVLEASKTEMT